MSTSTVDSPLFRKPDLLLLVPGLLAFAGQRMLARTPELTESLFSQGIYVALSRPLGWFSSLFPFSLTELAFWLIIPAVVTILIRIVIAGRTSDRPGYLWARAFIRLGWTLSVAYLLFMLLFGFHYSRLPLADQLQLDIRERPVEELAELSHMLAVRLNKARELVEEDENGVMRLREGIQGTLRTGYIGFQMVGREHPPLHSPRRRAKGVLASHWWSYTQISGMFFPFFMEANVNIAMPEPGIASTTMHELAHLLGFAREYEAEFAGFLAGLAHPNPDFVYSALLKAYIYSINALGPYDARAFVEVNNLLSDGVRRDMDAQRQFWRQFAGPVGGFSSRVNDAYLRSNMQVEGVRSYGTVVDLLLAWRMTLPAVGDQNGRNGAPAS